MKKTPTNQKGITLVEGLIIVIALALILFVGYYVWHTQKQANKTLNTAAKASQSAPSSSSKHLSPKNSGQKIELANSAASFVLPKGWTSARPASICSGTTDNVLSCLDSIEGVPADVTKAQTGDAFGVDIVLLKVTDGKNAHNWYFDDYVQALQDSSYTVSPENVNGLQGIHVTQTTNSYIDESYVLRKDDNVLLIQSRVSDTSYSPGGTTVTSHQDNTKYTPNIKKLAASVIIR